MEKKIRGWTMIKSTTTVAEKSLLLIAMALFALIIAVMADIPDTMFIGILLLAITSLGITVYLAEKEEEKDK